MSSAILNNMREFGRISVCGSISSYNSKKGEQNLGELHAIIIIIIIIIK